MVGINSGTALICSFVFFAINPIKSLCCVGGFVKWFIRKEDGKRGEKAPKPQTKQSFSPFGQMVRAEPSWIGYCPNWNHIGVLFSGDARDALRDGAARGGEKSPTAEMQSCEKSSRRLRGIPAPPGLLLLTQGQARADTSQLHRLAFLFPVEITAGNGSPQIA